MSEFAEIFDRYRKTGDLEKPAQDESEEGKALHARFKWALAKNSPQPKQPEDAMKQRSIQPVIGTRG